MNKLLHPPVTEKEIDGVMYHINTSWKSGVTLWSAWQAYEAGELSGADYLAVLKKTMFLEPQPSIYNEEAMRFASDYLNYFSEDKSAEERKSKVPPINIEQDWEMIRGAFLAMGINLRTTDIDYETYQGHWRNMPKDCEYCIIQQYRHKYYNEYPAMNAKEKAAFNKSAELIGWDRIKVKSVEKKTHKQNDDDFEW